MVNDLRASWADLTGGVTGAAHIRSEPVDVQTPAGPVRVGLDVTGVRHLLIPVPDASEVREDRHSQGVVVVAQDLVVDTELQSFADVVCVDSRLSDVYINFAESLLDDIAERREEHGKLPAQQLGLWRKLLAGPPDVGLPDDVVTGLIGELNLLERAHAIAGPSVLASWQGPLGGEHDFTATETAVEVKTTRSKEGRRVRINGLGQLAPWEDTPLHLYFVRVRRDPNGATLRELVSEHLTLFEPRELLDRLSRIGYAHTTDGEQHGRWTVLETAMYVVDDSFPRLTPDDLRVPPRPGVEDVSYLCDLALAGEPMDEQRINDVVGRLAA